jgi:Domain of unknown function (DUF6485)
MDHCSKEKNMKNCNCTYSCSKKGICCKCLLSHRRNGEIPACYFPKDIESTGNRSIENFIQVYKERGAWW